MKVGAVKHAVVAGRHRPAASALGQIGAHHLAGAKSKSAVVGVKHLLHHQRMLYQAAMVILCRGVVVLP